MLSVNTGRFPTRGHKTSRLSSDLWGLSLENHTAFFAISGREECAFCNKVPRYIPPPPIRFWVPAVPPSPRPISPGRRQFGECLPPTSDPNKVGNVPSPRKHVTSSKGHRKSVAETNCLVCVSNDLSRNHQSDWSIAPCPKKHSPRFPHARGSQGHGGAPGRRRTQTSDPEAACGPAKGRSIAARRVRA